MAYRRLTRKPAQTMLATQNEPFLKTGSILQIYQIGYMPRKGENATPSGQVRQERYFRNRWILMSYGHVRTGLAKDTGLPSRHRQIADFSKTRKLWKSRPIDLGTNQ